MRLQVDVFHSYSFCSCVPGQPSHMEVEGYMPNGDKAAVALLCISSFSLDSNLALVQKQHLSH